MVKIIVLLLSAGLAVLTVLGIAPSSLAWSIILGILLFIGYIVAFVALFFLTYIILGLFVKKGEIKKYSKFYHRVYVITTKICMSLFGVKMHISGFDKVPSNGTFIVVHNHLSNMDPVIINAVFGKHDMVFMAKKSLAKIPFFGNIIRGTGFLFLDRDNPTKDAYQLARAIKYLKTDTCCVGIAPEGTRNFTEEILLPFKDGSFIMAKKSARPIVVCVFKGTENIKHHLLTRIHHVDLIVSDVIEASIYESLTEKELSDLVRDKMLQVLNEKNGE